MTAIKDVIEFPPHCQLGDIDRELVSSWASMQKQIDARENNGFSVRKIVVNGASLLGQGEKRRPLMVQARVTYSTPEFGEATYHTNFIPDASTLLVVFRIVDKEATSSQAIPLEDHYALLVKQARYGMNERLAEEIPGGLVSENGESPKLEALRETIEEAVSPENRRLLPEDLSEEAFVLGAPIPSHPALTDIQYQFAVNIDVNRRMFKEIHQAFDGSRAGTQVEKESTIVGVVPLKQAYDYATEHGGGPLVALTRYMRHAGLIRLAS